MAAGFVILLLIAFTFGNRDHEPDSHAGHDHAEESMMNMERKSSSHQK